MVLLTSPQVCLSEQTVGVRDRTVNGCMRSQHKPNPLWLRGQFRQWLDHSLHINCKGKIKWAVPTVGQWGNCSLTESPEKTTHLLFSSVISWNINTTAHGVEEEFPQHQRNTFCTPFKIKAMCWRRYFIVAEPEKVGSSEITKSLLYLLQQWFTVD